MSKKLPFFLEAQGLEPWTLGLQSRCSSQLSHAPMPWADGKKEREAWHAATLKLSLMMCWLCTSRSLENISIWTLIAMRMRKRSKNAPWSCLFYNSIFCVIFIFCSFYNPCQKLNLCCFEQRIQRHCRGNRWFVLSVESDIRTFAVTMNSIQSSAGKTSSMRSKRFSTYRIR